MAIIFEDANGYISYIQPENILWIKSCDESEHYIRYAKVDTDDNYNLGNKRITKETVKDIFNQLAKQNFKFIDLNEKLSNSNNSTVICYINQDAIESIRTYNDSRKGPTAFTEIKTNLKHFNITTEGINLKKTKQFIKGLVVKK